jgi:hypothetical protein
LNLRFVPSAQQAPASALPRLEGPGHGLSGQTFITSAVITATARSPLPLWRAAVCGARTAGRVRRRLASRSVQASDVTNHSVHLGRRSTTHEVCSSSALRNACRLYLKPTAPSAAGVRIRGERQDWLACFGHLLLVATPAIVKTHSQISRVPSSATSSRHAK